MGSSKYLISYDWRAPRGIYVYMQHFETNWFVVAIIKLCLLKFKYDIIDLYVRGIWNE